MTTTTYTSQNGTTVTIEYADLADETQAGTILATVTVTNNAHAISDVYLNVPLNTVDAQGTNIESLIAYSTDNGQTTLDYSTGVYVGAANSVTFQLVSTGEIDFSDFGLKDGLTLSFFAGLDDSSIYDEFDPVVVAVEEGIETTSFVLDLSSFGFASYDENDSVQINLADGRIMVVASASYAIYHEETTSYSNGAGVFAQIFNADGSLDGEATIYDSGSPSVSVADVTAARLENGEVAVVWSSTSGGVTTLNTVTVGSDGDLISATQPVTAGTVASYDASSIVALDNGGYVISYKAEVSGSAEILAQRFDQNGIAVGTEFQVNTDATSDQRNPKTVAIHGGFAVAFESSGVDDDGSPGVRMRLFANDGTALGDEITISETTDGDQNMPSVAALEGGGFAATWLGYDQDFNPILYGRIFTEMGVAATGEFAIAGSSSEYVIEASVTALGDGSVLVAWLSADADWTVQGVFGQVYNADGTARGSVIDFYQGEEGVYYDSFKVEQTDNGVVSVSVLHDSSDTYFVSTKALYNAPIQMAISAHAIAENAANGTVIGALSATDADGDTLTYTLDDDADGLFSLVTENGTTKLVVNGALDYETATSHSVVVMASDGEHETRKTFTIDITDVNENTAPTGIEISNNEMLESSRVGFAVGALSATDAEGDAITWSLVPGSIATGNHNDYFQLKINTDGSTSVFLKSPLNHENGDGGVYHLIVKATDENGASTTRTIDISALDDPFKLSSVPTGKDYVGVVESAKVGQEIGFVMAFDDSFAPVSATLVDDANGAFSIKTRVVGTETRYYLVTDKKLNFETADSHSVTIRATDADGLSYDKTIDVKVLDAPEIGDTARGRIKIDASTALAGQNGGVNWNTYLDAYFAGSSGGLPNMTAKEYLYTFYGMGEEHKMSVRGSGLTYNPNDPITGEDTHTVSGAITDIIFGEGKTAFGSPITKTELSITGLDLANDSTPLQRVYGEVNAVISAFMHGEDSTYPDQLAQVKAILASYAQTFEGSSKADAYTGTIFNDVVRGNSGADVINGSAGNDRLSGGAGADIVRGGSGDDRINGGAAADKLYGNAGADTFIFTAAKESAKSAFDTILDFAAKENDHVDLSAIDANIKKGGNQAFTFIGSQDFHHKAGELQFDKIKGDTVISGDTNGDGKADFVLHLDDAMNLRADYFVL